MLSVVVYHPSNIRQLQVRLSLLTGRTCFVRRCCIWRPEHYFGSSSSKADQRCSGRARYTSKGPTDQDWELWGSLHNQGSRVRDGRHADCSLKVREQGNNRRIGR